MKKNNLTMSELVDLMLSGKKSEILKADIAIDQKKTALKKINSEAERIKHTVGHMDSGFSKDLPGGVVSSLFFAAHSGLQAMDTTRLDDYSKAMKTLGDLSTANISDLVAGTYENAMFSLKNAGLKTNAVENAEPLFRRSRDSFMNEITQQISMTME